MYSTNCFQIVSVDLLIEWRHSFNSILLNNKVATSNFFYSTIYIYIYIHIQGVSEMMH